MKVIKNGSPEFKIVGCIPAEGISVPDLTKIMGKDAYKVYLRFLSC
jgi:hypothetical protein